MEERRTFNTSVREPWNAPIHQMLKAIDNHTSLYLSTGDEWHHIQAMKLRRYLWGLKTWITDEEARAVMRGDYGQKP